MASDGAGAGGGAGEALAWRVAGSADLIHVARVALIVNEAYDYGEGKMFIEGHTRTSEAMVKAVLEDGRLLLATLPSTGTVVGCITTTPNEDASSVELGMLAVAGDCRGTGAGRFLMRAGETRARELGASVLALKLLRYRDYSHPVKQRLHAWYQRLGFVPKEETIEVDTVMPEAFYKALARPSLFVTYSRPLPPPADA